MGTGHGCCAGIALDRRRLLAGAAGLMAFRPLLVRAASGDYEAMVLACIDPRMQEPVFDYLKKRGLDGQYSQFTIAGAAIGVVAPKFADWHKAFWDNVGASRELHNIKRVIVIDHRDCGAAKIAYGPDSIATPEKENAIHRTVLADFHKQVAARAPKLAVETGLMALDGSMMMFS
jgi:Putative carbonic anhydrase